MLMYRLLAALPLALLAITPATAEPDVLGRWVVDRERSLASLTASKTVGAEEAGQILAMFGNATVEFQAGRLSLAIGPQTLGCDWSWGAGQEIAFRNCLNQRKQPAPGAPEKMVLGEDGFIRFIEADGSALTFRRAG